MIRIAGFGTLADAIEASPTSSLDASIVIESQLRAAVDFSRTFVTGHDMSVFEYLRGRPRKCPLAEWWINLGPFSDGRQDTE